MVTFFRLTCSALLWGKGGTCQISLASVGSACSVSATLGFPCSRCVCFPSLHCSGFRLLCQELSDVDPGLSALPRSKLFRFRYSGTPQRCRLGWALLCPFVPFPGQSSSGDQVFGERGRCDLSPPLSLLFFFLRVQPVHFLRRMLTIQNRKKSWLAMKPACSLV